MSWPCMWMGWATGILVVIRMCTHWLALGSTMAFDEFVNVVLGFSKIWENVFVNR